VTDFHKEETAMKGRSSFNLKGAGVFAAAAFLLLSCNLLAAPALGGSDSGGGENATVDIPPVPIGCPTEDIRATMTFSHDISYGLPGAGMFGLKVQGSYEVNIVKSIATYEPDAKVGVYNLNHGPFPVTVTAKDFKGCTDGQGKTDLRALVNGTCINGTLTLYIQEYYEAASVTIMCGEKKDQKVEIPIPVGAMEQPIVWTVPIGQLAGGGTQKTVDFSGEGGSGGMTYLLKMP
jgi:hypothetical protein